MLRNTALGVYDFRTYWLYISRLYDPDLFSITDNHERTHHRLTTWTVYGMALQEAAKRDGVGGPRGTYGPATRMLTKHCRIVQEMVATYQSLIFHPRREEILGLMPSLYQEAYARASAMADRAFESPLLRTAFIFTVGRCAMSVGFGDDGEVIHDEVYPANGPGASDITMKMGIRAECDFIDQLIARGQDLPPQLRPDHRLGIIERTLAEMPADSVMSQLRSTNDAIPFLELPSMDAVEKALGGRFGDWSAVVSRALSDTLCGLLETSLPGVESNVSWARSYRNASQARKFHWLGESGKINRMEEIYRTGDQTVVWAQGPVPGVDLLTPRSGRAKKKLLDRIMTDSYAKSGSLSYFVEDQGPDRDPVCYVMDLLWQAGKPDIVRCLQLEEEDYTTLSRSGIPHVTIVEEDDFINLLERPLPAHVYEALTQNCFIRVAINIFDSVGRGLRSGRHVDWSGGPIGYKNNAVRPDEGLGIVLYVVEGIQQLMFHPSNYALWAALHTFSEEIISDPEKLRFVDAETFKNQFHHDSISHLIDHPIFGCFHAAGMRGRIIGTR
ncbi:hypothetical protein OG742_41950 [Streptomyces sp. NBC_00828]|uniref:hypothetical protein n=1 Tax=Streptomyces sp. NBC_00828 TaxID=2903678 RepID=UPI00386DA99A